MFFIKPGEESWKEIAADMKVRKLNTFCYLLIMLGSASRLFIYLTFHPSLRKCRCRCSSEWNDETEHVIESTFQRSYPNYRPQPTARGNRYTVEPICDDAETTAADSQFLQLAHASFKGNLNQQPLSSKPNLISINLINQLFQIIQL